MLNTQTYIPQTHSFRLKPRTAREERALDILMSRRMAGHTVREIVIEALLKLEEDSTAAMDEQLSAMHTLLEETFRKVETLSRRPVVIEQQVTETSTQESQKKHKAVSGDFLAKMKKGARPGQRLATDI